MSRVRTRKAPPTANPLIPPNTATPVSTATLPALTAETALTRSLGASGLKRPALFGLLNEEFLPELSGNRAIKKYREMRDNDSIVGAVMFAIESMLRGVTWSVRGGNEQSEEFLEECVSDLRPNFASTITEVLSMLPYGWSFFEVLYKRRNGPAVTEELNSKFNDGRIGWQKWAIRSQDSLSGWEWDPDGKLLAMHQQAPPYFRLVRIPLERALHFTTSIHKENPEGRSLFRSAYRAWLFRRNLEVIEAIGAERDLAGIPVFYRDMRYENIDAELKSILRNVKRDEQEGLVIPLVMDENGKKLIEFSLLSTAGARQFDCGSIIERKGREIAMVMLADFIMLGHERVGSNALSTNKTDMYMLAMRSILENIKSTINEIEVPRLFKLNGLPVDDLPELTFGDIEKKDLKQLGDFISALASSGMPMFPDPDLEKHLRECADLPEKSEDAMRMQEEDRAMQMEAQAASITSMQNRGLPAASTASSNTAVSGGDTAVSGGDTAASGAGDTAASGDTADEEPAAE